jgi:methylenetetrahydrofolate reductase (NADPH)
MEAADKSGNAQEEGVQIALETINRIKTYRQQGIHGIHLMPVAWDEIVPRIVTEAGLLLEKNVVQEPVLA